MPKPRENENQLPEPGALLANNLFSMKNRICVVTGGGSGIGAMIAAAYIENGAKVYIVSRKDISSYADELNARGFGKCIALQADFGNPDDTVAFVKNLEKLEPNGVNVLVNNAGTNWAAPLSKYPIKAWDKVYDLNVRAVFHLTQQMVPLLAKKGTIEDPSTVLNIASIAAVAELQSQTFAYNSGKAAVAHLTKHLAAHLCAKNISCNAILPGMFPSRMSRETIDNFQDMLLDNIPMARFGHIEDMAANVLLMSSKGGSWMTGVNLVLDGGQSLNARRALASL